VEGVVEGAEVVEVEEEQAEALARQLETVRD
jgi:hypothetical protein